MNICMVVNNLAIGGVERVVLGLLRGLDPGRFTPHLVCLDGGGELADELEIPASRCLVLRKRAGVDLLVGTIDPTLVTSIRRFLRDNAIDVVHAHNHGPLLFGGAAAHLTGRRRPAVVYSEHNQIERTGAVGRAKFRVYAELADRVVAVSNDVRGVLVGALGLRSEVRVIPNGLDGAPFANAKPIRAKLGLRDGDFAVLTTAALRRQKGIVHLLEAAKHLALKAPHVRYLIAGDGPERASLARHAEGLGLDGRVLFLGARRDVPELLATADAFVLPSLSEGMPVALVEALASGKPIVATAVGGNPEVVEDRVNGLLVRPGDSAALANAILALVHDPAFRARARITNVKRFTERFALEPMVARHAGLYEEAHRARRPASRPIAPAARA